MKIAASVSLVALTALVVFAGEGEAWAQTPGSIVPAKVEMPGAASPGAKNVPEAASAVKNVLDNIKVQEPTVGAVNKDKKEELSEEEVEDVDLLASTPEVPISVKGAVKRLNHATEDVTIEDLNSAREAVAKLDVLIDIEKRLNDLVSLRKERGGGLDDLSAAIPPAALGAPMALPTPVPSANPVPMPMMGSDITVSRIAGASGRYTALIKDADGSDRQIKVGDKLADGSSVDAISRNGVSLSSGSKKRTIQVKDVNAFFGDR